MGEWRDNGVWEQAFIQKASIRLWKCCCGSEVRDRGRRMGFDYADHVTKQS